MPKPLQNFARHKNKSADYRLAKTLRQSNTIVEKLLWQRLRQLSNNSEVRFRRQHPIQPYIADFVCLTARLAVEIDGMSHETAVVQDQQRQKYIEQQGFHVIRFTNAEIMKDVNSVAAAIVMEAEKLQKKRWNKNDPSPNLLRKFDPPARGG